MPGYWLSRQEGLIKLPEGIEHSFNPESAELILDHDYVALRDRPHGVPNLVSVGGTPRGLARNEDAINDFLGQRKRDFVDVYVHSEDEGKEFLFMTTPTDILEVGIGGLIARQRMQAQEEQRERARVFGARRERQVFVRKHDRKIGVYPEGRYFRERVMEPSKCQPGSLRTIDIGAKVGHKAVICRPKGLRTTRTQSILHPRNERERKKLGLPKRARRSR